MPKIIKQFQLEITPEQFLNNCSGEELKEIELLLQRPFYQLLMNDSQEFPGIEQS